MSPEQSSGVPLRDYVARRTQGDPADRDVLKGSDEKWEGYLLGVEDATEAAREWVSEQLPGAYRADLGDGPAITCLCGTNIRSLRPILDPLRQGWLCSFCGRVVPKVKAALR